MDVTKTNLIIRYIENRIHRQVNPEIYINRPHSRHQYFYNSATRSKLLKKDHQDFN